MRGMSRLVGWFVGKVCWLVGEVFLMGLPGVLCWLGCWLGGFFS